MKADHLIRRDQYHYFFNREHKPILHVKPSDVVKCEMNDVSNYQITKDNNFRPKIDRSRFFPLAGPIYVEGAKAGDSLIVNILEVKPSEYGWSGIYPIFGFPDDQDPEYALINENEKRTYLHIWDLSDGKYAKFNNEIKVPISPFCGTIGVAPKESGNPDAHSGPNRDGTDMTAFKHGGNMDIKHLTNGSKLILPVFMDGALFSCGDPHAAQGDGELDAAIESPSEVTLSFEIERKTIPNPRYVTPESTAPAESYFGATGNAPDLVQATIQARSNMMEFLVDRFALSRADAYMLIGVAADLRVHQCVNGPNWTVGLMMPRSVIGET
jgi:acetamidase/formamidase